MMFAHPLIQANDSTAPINEISYKNEILEFKEMLSLKNKKINFL